MTGSIERLGALDSARGLALLLVCLSHFASVYSRGSGFDLSTVYYATMVAAPTFMLLSGMLLGHFYVIKKAAFQSVTWDFLDRGLFILLVARILILLSFVPKDGLIGSFRNVFITDAIAFNIIVGPLIVSRLDRVSRLGLASGCWAVSWAIVIGWNPASFSWEFVKEGFFGDWFSPHVHALNYAFPIAPWFGLYLVGTVVGESLANHLRSGDLRFAARYLIRGGSFSIAASLTAKTIFLFGKKYSLSKVFSSYLAYALTSPTQKSPPSLAYFCFYGGCGAVTMGLFLYCEKLNFFSSAARLAALLGRNSLLVFVGQYYVYYVFFYLMNLSYSVFWPAYFMLSVLVIVALAAVGDARKLSRHFKVPAHRLCPGFDPTLDNRFVESNRPGANLPGRN